MNERTTLSPLDRPLAPLAPLFSFGDPRETWRWRDREPDYVARFGLSSEHVPELIKVAVSWADDQDEGPDDESVYAPIHAWRALAQLGAVEAVQSLLGILQKLDDMGDDWYLEEFPFVFGLIGPAAIDPLAGYVADTANREYPRISAAHGLCEIAKRHPESRDRVVQLLTEQLAKQEPSRYALNAFYISYLLDLRAVESAEVIERAYSVGAVDEGVCGDWNDARNELGVDGVGLVQPEHPYDSLKELRQSFWSAAETEPKPLLTRMPGVSLGDSFRPAAETDAERQARRNRRKRLKARRKQQQRSRRRNRKRD